MLRCNSLIGSRKRIKKKKKAYDFVGCLVCFVVTGSAALFTSFCILHRSPSDNFLVEHIPLNVIMTRFFFEWFTFSKRFFSLLPGICYKNVLQQIIYCFAFAFYPLVFLT